MCIYLHVFVNTHAHTCSGSKVAFCILSNTCMGLGINTIALLEIRGEGVTWNNFYRDISLDDDFHIGYVFLMLIIDSTVYMLIAWYLHVHVHVYLLHVYSYTCTCMYMYIGHESCTTYSWYYRVTIYDALRIRVYRYR